MPLCQPVRNHRATTLSDIDGIGYCASKKMWYYGLKVHILVSLSGMILNYVVTPASVHDSKVAEALLEGCSQTTILADLGYLGKDLKERLENIFGHLYDRIWIGLRNTTTSESWLCVEAWRPDSQNFVAGSI